MRENLTELEKHHENEKLLLFFFKIDTAAFGTVRSNILGKDLWPNVNQAYPKIIQGEQGKNMESVEDGGGTAAAFFVQSNITVDKSSLFCYVRSKEGHESKSCFEVVVYPEWWLEKNRNGGGRTENNGSSNRGRHESGSSNRISGHASSGHP